tara:strand:- start:2209 stop:2700 length:492 start_codon:yes stop_codon:yes gene_type:complete
MIDKNSQSVFDYVMLLLPEMGRNVDTPNYINPTAVRQLYSIWRDDKNKVGKNTLHKPVTLSSADVDTMERSGLVKSVGHNLELTDKGVDAIRVMVLGNDKSIFEDDGNVIDYQRALAFVKNPSVITAKQDRVNHRASTVVESPKKEVRRNRSSEDNWWARFSK